MSLDVLYEWRRWRWNLQVSERCGVSKGKCVWMNGRGEWKNVGGGGRWRSQWWKKDGGLWIEEGGLTSVSRGWVGVWVEGKGVGGWRKWVGKASEV